jgi:hypothetical protein
MECVLEGVIEGIDVWDVESSREWAAEAMWILLDILINDVDREYMYIIAYRGERGGRAEGGEKTNSWKDVVVPFVVVFFGEKI